MMATTYVPIESVTLASSAASVSLTSIPNTFTDLVLRFTARNNQAGGAARTLTVRFNGDDATATTYSYTFLRGDGASGTSGNATGGNNLAISYINGDAATANTFSSSELYVPNYAATAKKPVSLIGANETNATTAFLYATAGLANATTAVSSIQLTLPGAEQFLAGSTFHLYGIKNS